MHRRSSTDTGLETTISRQTLKGQETTGNRSNREATGVSSGTVPLMETGGLNWFVGTNSFPPHEACRFPCHVQIRFIQLYELCLLDLIYANLVHLCYQVND